MMDGTPLPDAPYPGASATPHQVLNLARAYAHSAEHLFENEAGKPAAMRAPARFCALHSIELFVQAFLRFRGVDHEQVRGRHHDLWHAEFVRVLGLGEAVSGAIRELSLSREYLIVRYGPDQFDRLSSDEQVIAAFRAIRKNSDRIPFTA